VTLAVALPLVRRRLIFAVRTYGCALSESVLRTVGVAADVLSVTVDAS
jgi:hypothetical protein